MHCCIAFVQYNNAYKYYAHREHSNMKNTLPHSDSIVIKGGGGEKSTQA